jgi:DNA polymerase III subunit delta
MKFVELKKQLNEKVKNCYILYGNDNFVIGLAEKMIDKFCGNECSELNKNYFNDENINFDNILDLIYQYPLMNDRRLVVIRNFKSVNKEGIKVFEKFLSNPPDFSTLVIESDSTFKLENAEVVDCNKLDQNSIISWISLNLKDKNKQITLDGANKLVQYCDFDLGRISNELDKLLSMPNEKITSDLVENNVSKDNNFLIFDITDSIGRKDCDRALTVLNNFLQNKGKEQLIYGLISSYFRKMFYASCCNESNEEIANYFNVKEYAIKKAREQSRFFGTRKIKIICDKLNYFDSQIKIGNMNIVNALYYIVIYAINL